MNYLKKIPFKDSFGKYIFLFLTLILMNNILAKPTDEKLNEFYSHNVIKYSAYDNSENQLKIFFGYDSEHPEESFYPDLLIINYSEQVRDLYGQKLKDMTINRKIYNINE